MWHQVSSMARRRACVHRLSPRVAAVAPSHSVAPSTPSAPRLVPSLGACGSGTVMSAGAGVTPAIAHRGPLAATPLSSVGAHDFSGLRLLGGTRTFYFPRRNWFPWRVRLIHNRQAALRKKRHIWPRYKDPQEAPIFGPKEDGSQLSFRDKEIRLGLKRMEEYSRLLKGRQLQDAIDWVESLARLKSEPILKLLRRAMKELEEKHRLDVGRCYITQASPQRGYYIRTLRKHTRGKFGIAKAPRHLFLIRIRELPMEEYFHRVYIYGKVPRSLACDMRLALHESRVSNQMAKEWAPYLTSHSRLLHRKELKWLDSTRQFDYYQARREWIQRYKANLLRASTEAREARGLPPLPVAD